MNDQDYIRKAVELADGFQISSTDSPELETYYFPTGMGHTVRIGHAPQCWLDALAAQLERQVDALDNYFIEALPGWTALREGDPLYVVTDKCAAYGPDRTMNTIKAIVDSEVLT